MQDEFHDNYQLRFNEMNNIQKAQLITFEKGLGISGQKVAEIVQRQIQRTGKASTESLEKISAFAKSVSDATGVSFKQIAAGIAEIITNVETFGNVQEEEAARIAGTLQQLGTSFRSFGNMVNKFMSFDTAASEIGKLTSVFGVHMDAMEMMQLANEDEEEFLHRVRDAFIDQGIAVEDLTKAQRNMLASTLGLQAAEIENFFDPDLLEVDFDELAEATDQADVSEGFEDMISNTVKAQKTAEDFKKDLNTANFAPYRDQLFVMGKGLIDLKQKGFDAAVEGTQLLRTGIESLIGAGSGLIKATMDEEVLAAELRRERMNDIAQELETGQISSFEAVTKAGAENHAKLMTIFTRLGIEGIEDIQKNTIRLEKGRLEATKNYAKDVSDAAAGLESTKIPDEVLQQQASTSGMLYTQSFVSSADLENAITQEVGSVVASPQIFVSEDNLESMRSQISSEITSITSDATVNANVTTIVSDTTMEKLNKIEEQQIFIKNERDTVFERISTGIDNLATKIVAKIEEGRIINRTTIFEVNKRTLVEAVTEEIDGQVIPRVDADNLGEPA